MREPCYRCEGTGTHRFCGCTGDPCKQPCEAEPCELCDGTGFDLPRYDRNSYMTCDERDARRLAAAERMSNDTIEAVEIEEHYRLQEAELRRP